ncbi:MAG: hypothetical protein AUJ01_07660 [Acidobacteria bacterium 13_1_40CM_3_65_5]|nr:MAG: hypothetical protein AUJ01_07660 [Acidobacteria bacterium 13_1_40CM_3_65_5]
MALVPTKYRSASASLTTATAGAVRLSVARKSRPSAIISPRSVKYPGVTERSGIANRSLGFVTGCPSISTIPGQAFPVNGVPHANAAC